MFRPIPAVGRISFAPRFPRFPRAPLTLRPHLGPGAPSGFTLIELLVCVAIVAVLISMLLPSLKITREIAAATLCSANMNQLGRGITNYATDNVGKYPWGTQRCGVGPYTAALPTATWDNLTDAYFGGDGIIRTDPSTYQNGNTKKLAVLICPRDPFGGNSFNAPRSYQMNAVISGGDNLYAGVTSSAATYTPPVSLKMEGVPDPAGTFLLVETPNNGNGRGRQGASVSAAFGPFSQSQGIGGVLLSGAVYISNTAPIVTTHPFNKFNYLYCDGHETQIYPLATDTRPGVLCNVAGCRNATPAADPTFGPAWDWSGANPNLAPKPWNLR